MKYECEYVYRVCFTFDEVTVSPGVEGNIIADHDIHWPVNCQTSLICVVDAVVLHITRPLSRKWVPCSETCSITPYFIYIPILYTYTYAYIILHVYKLTFIYILVCTLIYSYIHILVPTHSHILFIHTHSHTHILTYPHTHQLTHT